jgi:hypothetical protein
MRQRGRVIALVGVTAGLLAWPRAGAAQTVVGNANVVRSTTVGVLGPTTVTLAATGALGGPADALDATEVTASIPAVFAGEVLNAVTVGWPDQVASEASVANVGLTVGGTGISADFVMARSLAALDGSGGGSALIDNLSIGGVPVVVTGEVNQTVAIPGGQVVINEQTGGTVNALHATVAGVADVVIASATAAIQ